VSWIPRGMVLLAAVGCFGFALFWEGLEEAEPLKLAVGTRMGSEALMFALSGGGDPDADRLRLVEMTGATALSRALENEVVDAAILSLDEALQMNDAGHPVRIALILEESNGADALLAKEEVREIAELKRKRVGVEVRSSGHYLLHKALESGGLTLADVELIPLTARETPSALATGEVDALVVTEPDGQRVGQEGVRRLFDSSRLEHPILRVLAVREAVWEKHKGVLGGVVESFLRAQPGMNAEDEVFVEFMERRTRLPREAIRECLKRSRFPGRQEMREWAASGRLAEVLEGKAESMKRADLLRGELENLPSWDLTLTPP
jgi:NitT/TauT family transport system substrate-binding protein